MTDNLEIMKIASEEDITDIVKSSEYPAFVLALKFSTRTSLESFVLLMDYWINLPLPQEVLESEVHQKRVEHLTRFRNIFSSYLPSLTPMNKGLEVPPQFGSGGSISSE
jgi:hypothetical protein